MRKSLLTLAACAALCAAFNSSAAKGAAQASRRATREVKVYLVAVGDAGRSGQKVGCDDSLVAVTRRVGAGGAPLKAAVRELLSMPREHEGRLGNYWQGENLRLRDVTLRGGTATIRITGRLHVAGVCDEPRIEGQIRETARQFPGVRRVRVFVNGRPLSQVIR
jgi:spore germination protein GerM